KDGLTDWLFDSGDAPQIDDTHRDESELDDWLSELNQLNGEEGGSDSASLEDISDAPDWLVQGIEESESEEPVVDDTSANIASEIVHSLMGDAEHVPTDFAELFQVDTDDSEGLPDWLANAAASGNNFVAEDDEPPEMLDELFEKEEFAAQSELDWLMQTGGLELPESSTGQLGIPDEQKGPSPKAEELDWLSDLASLDTNTLQAANAEADPADGDFDEAVHSEPASDLEEISTEAGRTPIGEPFIADSEEWIDTASYLASESQLQKEMPDWLSGIEEPVSDEREPMPDEDAILDDELPNWLDNLEAKDEVLDVSSAFSELADDGEEKPTDPGELVGAPKEFAGEGLPNWLQDSTYQAGEADVFLPEEGDEEKALPDWLQRDEVAQQDELEAEGAFLGDVTSELDALLDDLPPASQEQLEAAELPDWLQVIRPGGEKPDDSSYVGESVSEVEQRQGPLAGLRGVIGIESAVTDVYENPSLPPLTVTTEQQQQVVLLRQLSQEGHIAAGVQPGASHVAAPAWLRILLALLLLGAVVAGLILPGSFMQAPDSLPGTEAAYQAIEAAAGQTVLVAFDYAPSMAGELSPQAERILQRLAENESVVLGISQYTAGTILADAALVQVSGSNLGYLPGEAVGLRLLSVCLQKNGGSCDVIPGWSNDAAMQEAISDVQLIVVLTGNRDNFVYWVEQVAQPTGIPMVAGITQSLGPVTDPYLASGQLAGVIEGAPGTAVYEQLTGVTRDTDQLQQRLNAQAFAQLLIVVLFLIGMIVYGVIAPVINRSRKAATTR
ncbi:MAG: hypothetical protein KC421_06555, partial [Anaerolineales bacterium]|nr:hypothetical protein [Anaerolineales bacterium]